MALQQAGAGAATKHIVLISAGFETSNDLHIPMAGVPRLPKPFRAEQHSNVHEKIVVTKRAEPGRHGI